MSSLLSMRWLKTWRKAKIKEKLIFTNCLGEEKASIAVSLNLTLASDSIFIMRM